MLRYVKAFTRDKLDLALVNFNILVTLTNVIINHLSNNIRNMIIN